MGIEIHLTHGEKAFLLRVARRRKFWLLFSILSVSVAVFFAIYHGLIRRDFTPPEFVIILLLLLSSRSQLRIWKTARIFEKIKPHISGQ